MYVYSIDVIISISISLFSLILKFLHIDLGVKFFKIYVYSNLSIYDLYLQKFEELKLQNFCNFY